MILGRYPEVTQLTLETVGAEVVEGMLATDRATLAHSLATGAMTMEAMRWAGCSDEAIMLGGIAGALHDVGKMHPTIQRLMAQTEGQKFTKDQAMLMRTHTTLGFLSLTNNEGLDMLNQSSAAEVAAYTAFMHHTSLTSANYQENRFAGICHTVQVCDVAHARLFDETRTYRVARDGAEYTPQQIGSQIIEQFLDFPPRPDGRLLPVEALVSTWAEEVARRQDLGTLD